MKKTTIIALLAFMMLPIASFAQWEQDTTFKPVGSDIFLEIHGVAVDPDGKVWIQSFAPTERIPVNRDLGDDGVPDTLSTRVIYVYNADGTPADFSPLSVIQYEDGSPADTLGRVWTGTAYEGYSGRGIETNIANGNIIISQFNRLYVIDYLTGMGLAKVEPGIGSLGEASSDAEGNIYISAVVGSGAPIIKYDSNLENPETLLTMTGSFSRDLQVSEDGNTIWYSGYTLGAVLKYTKPDEFSGFDALPDTVLRGIRAESYDIHPINKYLWVGSGSLIDVPGEPYLPQTWYAFDTETLGTADEAPLDSMRWVPGGTEAFDQARPRGLDFSADGTVAYVGGFSAAETTVDLQKFTTDQVFTSNEDLISGVPSGFSLEQNYPNPFNPTTNIAFSLNTAGSVSLKVYDITGREVASLVNERMSAGSYTRTFDATNLSSGVYFYALEANGFRLTNKMTLIK